MNHHLDVNRPMILQRAAVAGAAAMVPLPFVDDLLARAARETLMRRIANQRGVDVNDEAVAALGRLDGATARLASQMVPRARLVRGLRRTLVAVRFVGHAGDFAATFAVATLFDHYCARHHLGPGLDGKAARRLRRVIDAAIAESRGALAGQGLRAVASSTGGLLMRAPRAALRRLPRMVPLLGPSLSRALARGPEEALPTPRADAGAAASTPGAGSPGRSIVQRSMGAISGAARAAGNGWVETMVAAFDRRWAAETAPA